MPAVRIREVNGDDVPDIERLLRSLPGVWQESWRADVIERALSSAGDLALVALRGGALVGFVCAHDFGFRAYLSELIVSEAEQRSGVGTALLRHVESRLADRGCAVLIADVHPPAEIFYRRLGWAEPAATLLRRRLR